MPLLPCKRIPISSGARVERPATVGEFGSLRITDPWEDCIYIYIYLYMKNHQKSTIHIDKYLVVISFARFFVVLIPEPQKMSLQNPCRWDPNMGTMAPGQKVSRSGSPCRKISFRICYTWYCTNFECIPRSVCCDLKIKMFSFFTQKRGKKRMNERYLSFFVSHRPSQK